MPWVQYSAEAIFDRPKLKQISMVSLLYNPKVNSRTAELLIVLPLQQATAERKISVKRKLEWFLIKQDQMTVLIPVLVCACMFVCVHERERERESVRTHGHKCVHALRFSNYIKKVQLAGSFEKKRLIVHVGVCVRQWSNLSKAANSESENSDSNECSRGLYNSAA